MWFALTFLFGLLGGYAVRHQLDSARFDGLEDKIEGLKREIITLSGLASEIDLTNYDTVQQTDGKWVAKRKKLNIVS